MQPLGVPRLIERPRITRRLREVLATTHVLLTAPAGYGKSVALQSLRTQLPNCYHFQLSSADLDPSILRDRLRPYLKNGNTILLDDVHHLVDSPDACAWLQQRLQQPQPRWLLAGRQLPFDATMLIVTGAATHLPEELLVFSAEETTDLLGNRQLSAEWQTKLGGWSLALSLLSRLPPSAGAAETVTKSHLFAYLANAVFAQLSAELRRFMQITAVTLQFTPALAAKLWGDQTQAEQFLAEIDAKHLYLQSAEATETAVVEMANAADWVRYHDLIRDYLISEHVTREQHVQIANAAIDWYLLYERIDLAMEQAIASRLQDRIEEILNQVNMPYFHRKHSYLTLRRWIYALDKERRAKNPFKLVLLGNALSMTPGYITEARAIIIEAIRAATALGQHQTVLTARTNIALMQYRQGELTAAREEVMMVLADPHCEGKPRAFALRIATLILGDLADYDQLPLYYEHAITLTKLLGWLNEPMMNRGNRVNYLLIPRGQLAEAQLELRAVLDHFKDQPGWLTQFYVFLCEYLFVTGDWEGLRGGVAKLQAATEATDGVGLFGRLWLQHYRCLLSIQRGDGEAFESQLVIYKQHAADSPINFICAAWMQVWFARRRGDWQMAVALADQQLARAYEGPYQRGRLALERDIALGIVFANGERADFSLHADTKRLITLRAKLELVRLRALLAIVCHHQQNCGWRRHWRGVLRALQRFGYADLLTKRDPDLGVYFWRIGVMEGTDWAQTKRALLTIGKVDVLLPLLQSADVATRQRMAELLIAFGVERTLPAVIAAYSAEKHAATKKALKRTLDHLEQQPPPKLKLTLMGTFSLRRGDEAIPLTAWKRPIALRLFQFFALHARETISRDRVLDELWPASDPHKAAATLRTVLSWLRRVLEPYTRSKTPNRYLRVRGQSYLFDPHGRVDVDAVHFERVVRDALRRGDGVISAELLQTLEQYALLLPTIQYEEWLIEPRERLQELYLQGCHAVAQRYLQQANYPAAIDWAQRVVAIAPWMESAYRLLMVAYARQGQRTLALQAYEDVVAALSAELAVQPAQETRWLAERLRAGETL